MSESESTRKVFPATINAIGDVAIFLEHTLEHAGVPMIEAMRIQLAVEEAVTNVINHGYEGKNGDVSIQCDTLADTIVITITDFGQAFDPTLIPPADVTADLDHRRIGGLGVYLIRTVMDEVSYIRVGNENRLRLVKKFS